MLTQDEIERERHESRVKAQRDERSRLLYAEDVGYALGRAEALLRQIRLCQRLLQRPLSPAEELIRLVAELERLVTQMEKEVLPPPP